MSPLVRIQLSVMMFLQYMIWGSWGVTLATYLGSTLHFRGVEIGWVYNTMQIGAILSPLFIGLIADRFFATQSVISVCHLVGAGLLFAAAQAVDPRGVFLLMLAYALCFMPTLALTNSISFRNMNDPERQFPAVRVLGTIGWIVAGLLVGWARVDSQGSLGLAIPSISLPAFEIKNLLSFPGFTLTQAVNLGGASSLGAHGISDTNYILYLAAILSAALGVFAVFLPHTPPVKTQGEAQPGLFAALSMFKEPSFAILMLISFGISVALAFYYQLGNPFLESLKLENSAAWQTLGQWSEILFMLALPFIVRSIGVKWTLLLGMLAWCVRYGIFYSLSLPLILAIGLPLHGICYDFFFVVSQLYVDSRAPRQLRASAQGLLALITLGLGMFVGNILAGYTKDANTTVVATGEKVPLGSILDAFLPSFLWESPAETGAAAAEVVTHWPGVWAPAAIGCGIAVALFLVGFREKKGPSA